MRLLWVVGVCWVGVCSSLCAQDAGPSKSPDYDKLGFKHEEIECATLEELDAHVKAVVLSKILTSSGYIKAKGATTTIHVVKVSNDVSISVHYYWAGDERTKIRWVSTSEEPKSSLAKKVHIPEDRQKKLEDWLSHQGYGNEISYSKAEGPEGIVYFNKTCIARLAIDPEAAVRIVRFMLTEIVDAKPPYVITLLEQKPKP